jgi:hypothetical protein
MHNWRVNANGSVAGPAEGPGRTKYGLIDKNGDIYNSEGNIVGFVDLNGQVIDQKRNVVGWVDVDGTIYDEGSITVGKVTTKGEVYTVREEFRGWVDLEVHRDLDIPDARQMYMRAAAATFLMIFGKDDP